MSNLISVLTWTNQPCGMIIIILRLTLSHRALRFYVHNLPVMRILFMSWFLPFRRDTNSSFMFIRVSSSLAVIKSTRTSDQLDVGFERVVFALLNSGSVWWSKLSSFFGNCLSSAFRHKPLCIFNSTSLAHFLISSLYNTFEKPKSKITVWTLGDK